MIDIRKPTLVLLVGEEACGRLDEMRTAWHSMLAEGSVARFRFVCMRPQGAVRQTADGVTFLPIDADAEVILGVTQHIVTQMLSQMEQAVQMVVLAGDLCVELGDDVRRLYAACASLPPQESGDALPEGFWRAVEDVARAGKDRLDTQEAEKAGLEATIGKRKEKIKHLAEMLNQAQGNNEAALVNQYEAQLRTERALCDADERTLARAADSLRGADDAVKTAASQLLEAEQANEATPKSQRVDIAPVLRRLVEAVRWRALGSVFAFVDAFRRYADFAAGGVQLFWMVSAIDASKSACQAFVLERLAENEGVLDSIVIVEDAYATMQFVPSQERSLALYTAILLSCRGNLAGGLGRQVLAIGYREVHERIYNIASLKRHCLASRFITAIEKGSQLDQSTATADQEHWDRFMRGLFGMVLPRREAYADAFYHALRERTRFFLPDKQDFYLASTLLSVHASSAEAVEKELRLFLSVHAGGCDIPAHIGGIVRKWENDVLYAALHSDDLQAQKRYFSEDTPVFQAIRALSERRSSPARPTIGDKKWTESAERFNRRCCDALGPFLCDLLANQIVTSLAREILGARARIEATLDRAIAAAGRLKRSLLSAEEFQEASRRYPRFLDAWRQAVADPKVLAWSEVLAAAGPVDTMYPEDGQAFDALWAQVFAQSEQIIRHKREDAFADSFCQLVQNEYPNPTDMQRFVENHLGQSMRMFVDILAPTALSHTVYLVDERLKSHPWTRGRTVESVRTDNIARVDAFLVAQHLSDLAAHRLPAFSPNAPYRAMAPDMEAAPGPTVAEETDAAQPAAAPAPDGGVAVVAVNGGGMRPSYLLRWDWPGDDMDAAHITVRQLGGGQAQAGPERRAVCSRAQYLAGINGMHGCDITQHLGVGRHHISIRHSHAHYEGVCIGKQRTVAYAVRERMGLFSLDFKAEHTGDLDGVMLQRKVQGRTVYFPLRPPQQETAGTIARLAFGEGSGVILMPRKGFEDEIVVLREEK